MSCPKPESLTRNTIKTGDCLALLRETPDESVNLVITSPPYWQQRAYGGGASEIGSEKTPGEYLNKLVEVFRECVRVVKPDGHVVFNVGDKYHNGNLLLLPYQFAILGGVEGRKVAPELRLLNMVTWVKKNPTPRQFARRLVSSTEPFFHFVKTSRYYYNDTRSRKGRVRSCTPTPQLGEGYRRMILESNLTDDEKTNALKALDEVVHDVHIGKDGIQSFRMKIRNVHQLPYGGQSGGRLTEIERDGFTVIRIYNREQLRDVIESPVCTPERGMSHPAVFPESVVEFFIELCSRTGDLLLDPFIGSGTTAISCIKHDRAYLGFELVPAYVETAQARIQRAIQAKASIAS